MFGEQTLTLTVAGRAEPPIQPAPKGKVSRSSRCRLLLAMVLFCAAAPDARAQRAALLAVSNEASHTITLIDAKSLRVLRTIPMPQRPRGIEFSPDGSRVFVASSCVRAPSRFRPTASAPTSLPKLAALSL